MAEETFSVTFCNSEKRWGGMKAAQENFFKWGFLRSFCSIALYNFEKMWGGGGEATELPSPPPCGRLSLHLNWTFNKEPGSAHPLSVQLLFKFNWSASNPLLILTVCFFKSSHQNSTFKWSLLLT